MFPLIVLRGTGQGTGLETAGAHVKGLHIPLIRLGACTFP